MIFAFCPLVRGGTANGNGGNGVTLHSLLLSLLIVITHPNIPFTLSTVCSPLLSSEDPKYEAVLMKQ